MTEIKLAKFARVPPGAAMDKSLSKAALKVLIALCGHADSNDLCRPTQARLAQVSNLSRQHVNRALQELCGRGWIILAGQRRGRGKWPSNVYKVNFSNPIDGQEARLTCHPMGDTEYVTSEVTLSRRPIGDTNKSINQKEKEQRKKPNYRPNPYQTLIRTLERNGLSGGDLLSVVAAISPPAYAVYSEKIAHGEDPEQAILALLNNS